MPASIVPSTIIRRLALGGLVAVFLLLAAGAAQQRLPRDALWEIVHSVCVPGQTLHNNPVPCLRVDLTAGVEKGFAILKDPRDLTHFLLVPTAPIAGIESPAVLDPTAPNYFASAWETRHYVSDTLGKILSRDDIGLAVNSAPSRSQDQLHIHIDCVRPEVRYGLHNREDAIGGNWTPFPLPFFGQHYTAMWVPGEDLGASNPFRLLADGVPSAARDMGNRTLVMIGLTRANGTRGFVLLTDRYGAVRGDLAYGEELLDHSCRIAAQQNPQ